MRDSVAQACRAALSGDENARKCHPSVPYFTLGRRKVWVSLPKSPIHPYVILPCTFRQRKWAEVLPESVVLHSRATKMRDSVAQACRAALSGDENARKCHPSVPYFTLGRRKVWVSLPKSPIHPYVILPCTFRQRKWAEVSPESVVLHPRATKMRDSVAQACCAALSGDEKYGFRCRRVPFILTSFCPTPTGNKNGRKCRLSVPYYTLGRRKCSEVSPKRAVLYSRATKSVGFVAEESLHPYVILPCTFRQRKWAEVSPERVVPHSWATKKR